MKMTQLLEGINLIGLLPQSIFSGSCRTHTNTHTHTPTHTHCANTRSLPPQDFSIFQNCKSFMSWINQYYLLCKLLPACQSARDWLDGDFTLCSCYALNWSWTTASSCCCEEVRCAAPLNDKQDFTLTSVKWRAAKAAKIFGRFGRCPLSRACWPLWPLLPLLVWTHSKTYNLIFRKLI